MSLIALARHRTRNRHNVESHQSPLLLHAIANELAECGGKNETEPLSDARQLLAQAFQYLDHTKAKKPNAA